MKHALCIVRSATQNTHFAITCLWVITSLIQQIRETHHAPWLWFRRWHTVSNEANMNPFPGAYLNANGHLRLRPVTAGCQTLLELQTEFLTEPAQAVSTLPAQPVVSSLPSRCQPTDQAAEFFVALDVPFEAFHSHQGPQVGCIIGLLRHHLKVVHASAPGH